MSSIPRKLKYSFPYNFWRGVLWLGWRKSCFDKNKIIQDTNFYNGRSNAKNPGPVNRREMRMMPTRKWSHFVSRDTDPVFEFMYVFIQRSTSPTIAEIWV